VDQIQHGTEDPGRAGTISASIYGGLPLPSLSDIIRLHQKLGGYTLVHKVGPKGQVVISKEIRDRLGVKPGWLVLQRLVDDHVEVYFVPPEHSRSLKGSLAEHVKMSVAPGEEWDQAREGAWVEAAKKKASLPGKGS